MNNFQSLYMSEFLPSSPFDVTSHELAVFMRSFPDDAAKVWADFVEDNAEDAKVRQARIRLAWMAGKTERKLQTEREGAYWAQYIRRELVTEIISVVIKIETPLTIQSFFAWLRSDTERGRAQLFAVRELTDRIYYMANRQWLPAIVKIFVTD